MPRQDPEPVSLDDLSTFASEAGDEFLFRGQHRDYDSIYPTGFRAVNSQRTSRPYYLHALGAIHESLREVLSVQNGHEPTDDERVSEAILQHYDHISTHLDVTKSWQLACFFASLEITAHPRSRLSLDQRDFRTRLSVLNTRSDGDGFLYAFRRNDLNRIGLVDLSETLDGGKTSSIRPLRQEGCLVNGRDQHGKVVDFRCLAARVFQVQIEEILDILPTPQEMYPSASSDPILRHLLGFCFDVEDDLTDPQRPVFARLIEPIEREGDCDYSQEGLKRLVAPMTDKLSTIALE